MTEFLNRETHTQIFLIRYLQSLREVRIWANAVLKLTSRKTEIVRSVRGPKSQGPRAENVFVPRAEIFGDLITADHKVL